MGEQNDGWIEWKGGECPVSHEGRVAYRLRNGDECMPQRAGSLDWHHDGAWNDIIAYRVIPA